MKKTAISMVMAIAVVAAAFPALAAIGNGPHGKGAGPYAGGQNRAAVTKPTCDGTGPKGLGAGNQRPMDGRGKQYQGSTAQTPQPQTDQTAPPAIER
ncbi:hypothetical protein [Geotalea sp. SG265]|uniref:hypothetical protein n=1 Tax=Geotalea sp. SG265 TaxID=2922867 RepID=UPI001FB025E3|nr:hypothetical protein [Geotalea sp. SG265]